MYNILNLDIYKYIYELKSGIHNKIIFIYI